MKRYIGSCIPAVAFAFLAWAGGYDFNERGVVAFFLAYASLSACCLTFFWPGWRE